MKRLLNLLFIIAVIAPLILGAILLPPGVFFGAMALGIVVAFFLH